MASRAVVPGPPPDAHLQFTNTNLGKELKMNGVIRTYNDLYHEASRLHRIAAKPKVFPCKDLFSHAINFCELEKGQLVSPVGIVAVITRKKDTVKEVLRGWEEDATKIKHRPSIYYPISYFRKGVRIGMAMLNWLWGKADTDRVDQLWVPLLGFIIAQDKKPDFAEILSYNLHQNWKTAKEGNNFFMASYVMDACCASLRVEGMLTAPHKLPVHVSDHLVAEVASQCLLGVAGRCKRASQKLYPHIPFSIGDVYFQTWPALAKFGKEGGRGREERKKEKRKNERVREGGEGP
eukprot:Gb_32755 [translate_table: standard]